MDLYLKRTKSSEEILNIVNNNNLSMLKSQFDKDFDAYKPGGLFKLSWFIVYLASDLNFQTPLGLIAITPGSTFSESIKNLVYISCVKFSRENRKKLGLSGSIFKNVLPLLESNLKSKYAGWILHTINKTKELEQAYKNCGFVTKGECGYGYTMLKGFSYNI